MAESDRKHERSHGAFRDFPRRRGRPLVAGSKRGRIHRRQYGRVFGFGLCRERISHPCCQLEGIQSGEAGSYGVLRRAADTRSHGCWRLYETIIPGHDRSCAPACAHAQYLLGESNPFPLGEEIWAQTNGEIDAFVHSVGTGASLRGVATVLKSHNPKIKIIAVEPGESSVLSGGKPGAHDIEGIGIGYTPPLWDPNLVDEVLAVKTADAKNMARQLSRKEGIFAGTSSGGNVLAATRIASKLGPASKIVTLMVDSGLKYLSTDLYRTDSPPHH